MRSSIVPVQEDADASVIEPQVENRGVYTTVARWSVSIRPETRRQALLFPPSGAFAFAILPGFRSVEPFS
jgi:hypothetical protein